MNKLFLVILLSLAFTQVQYEGNSKYYQQSLDQIDFISLKNNPLVDRDFHPMVFKFGDEYDVDISVLNQARVYIDNDIYTFILGLNSDNAYGLGINFDNFFLTENAELFFYDRERTNLIGALTELNNSDDGVMTTSIIKGDNIIIELSVPASEVDDIRLNIDTVIHDYTDIMNYYNTIDSNREDCNINVVCEQGDEWRDQINGVVRVSMGGGLCSASLINNTANDRTPYILFADHCVSGSASGYVFYFNYQSSSCNGTNGSLNQSVSGSTLLVSEDINSGPDFALLRLNSDIPDSYNPYYVGWSNSSLPPQEAVGIHHPGADIKKISFTTDNVSSNGYYWEFQYEQGRVIPGSSGSPFFDQNKRQVGIASYIYTNYCDPSPDCYCSQQYDHGYGRFDSAWNMGLSSYLDPINSGVTTLDGISISGINIVHDAYDDIPYESSTLSFTAQATAYTGSIDAVELYYNFGDEWSSVEMESQFLSNNYEVEIDGIYDGMIVEYYMLAVNSEGVVQTYPNNAPENSIVFIVGDLPDIYTNNFEEGTGDWSIGDSTDDASAGIWELAEPLATFNDDGFQVAPGYDYSEQGSFCFVTGNGYEEGNGGYDDVDGGKTTLFSPVFNLESYDDVVMTFWRWYTNDIGDNGNNDKWLVQASTDGGVSWGNIENTSISNASWIQSRFILSNYIDLGQSVQFKFIAEDIFYNGDAGSGGSLVEAAIDDFKLEAISFNQYLLGDINADFTINILDVILLVNMALGDDPPNLSTGDINLDSEINILDVVGLISIILDS